MTDLKCKSGIQKTVFETIFKGNRHPHPLVYMRGVNSPLLGHVLMFLYQGEVDLPEDGVNDLLDFANEFNINGLAAKPDTTAVYSLEKPEDHSDDSKVVPFSEVDEKLRHIFKSEDPHHLDDEIEIDANARKGEKWQRIDRKRKKKFSHKQTHDGKTCRPANHGLLGHLLQEEL